MEVPHDLLVAADYLQRGWVLAPHFLRVRLRSKTRVVVAHRLSSIRTADRVVFLEDGAIVEDGTIAELLAAGGRFAAFAEHQRAGATWRLGA